MRLTLLSLPLPALVSCGSPCCPFLSSRFFHYGSLVLCFPSKKLVSRAVWKTGDGTKYAGRIYGNENVTITSALVADGVVDLSTGVIDEGREIGVFFYCTKLETVKLPESLRKIGFGAFGGCDKLTHVDIPSGVNELGEAAFTYCETLERISIPDGVVHLPNSIFYRCYSLKSVKLPASLNTIGEVAFCQCNSLTTINFGALKGVTEIGQFAFCECSSLTAFKLPPLLKTIEKSTFFNCSSLSQVGDIPPSLETVKECAFDGCHPDLSIDLPDSVTVVENSPPPSNGCQML